MARHYSPKSFFRHAPNAMLIRYFAKQGVLAEHDFSKVSETKIEPIYHVWLALPDAQRGNMERDFREIDALVCEAGIKAIIDEAEFHGENLAEELSELEGFHKKAFWVFLERPQYWPATSAFCRADLINSSQWNECKTINNSPAKVDEARRLSENCDRSEDEAGRAGFFDHLRRIVILFNEKDRKIGPGRFVRSRSAYFRTAS